MFKGSEEDALRDWSRCGELDRAKCRFNIWRAYLNLITLKDEETIRKSVEKLRLAYVAETEKYKISKSGAADVNVVNPLSRNSSVKAIFFFPFTAFKVITMN